MTEILTQFSTAGDFVLPWYRIAAIYQNSNKTKLVNTNNWPMSFPHSVRKFPHWSLRTSGEKLANSSQKIWKV